MINSLLLFVILGGLYILIGWKTPFPLPFCLFIVTGLLVIHFDGIRNIANHFLVSTGWLVIHSNGIPKWREEGSHISYFACQGNTPTCKQAWRQKLFSICYYFAFVVFVVVFVDDDDDKTIIFFLLLFVFVVFCYCCCLLLFTFACHWNAPTAVF